MTIQLEPEDVREALRIIRRIQAAHDALHAAENQLKVYENQLRRVYRAPEHLVIKDFTVGFEEAGNG